MNSTFSQRMKQLRKASKLTQEELGKQIGTTKGTISNYENGYSTPSNQMLVALSDVLNTNTDYLLGRTDDQNGAVEVNYEIEKVGRLQESADTERSFLNTVKLLDYVDTKEILDAVNCSIISGVSSEEIVSMLKEASNSKRRNN